MQLGQSKSKIEIHTEISKSNTFGIGDEKMIIEILRTKIYNDPIRVIVQEYISNGYDAHTEAGVNKPVFVTLPSQFGVMAFKVRDFGDGISPDRVAHVFTKFGNSTKRTDNEQIGGFGLGAKSAFSYTDAFSVITINNELRKGQKVRMKRTYSCYIDQTKMGKMDVMKEEETADPTGTEIIIPVQTKDFNSFNHNFFRLFQFFAQKPEFTGTKNIFEEVIFYQKNDHWGIYNKSTVSYTNDGSLLVTLGQIPYKISQAAMKDVVKSTEELAVLNSNFIMFLKVGEVNIASNREDLYYDEKTKGVLHIKIKEIVKNFRDEIQKSIDGIPTLKDAIAKYTEICSINKTVNMICEGKIKYKGAVLEPMYYYPLDEFFIRAQEFRIEKADPKETTAQYHIVSTKFTNDHPKHCKISKDIHIILNNDGSIQPNKAKLLTYFKKYGEGTALWVINKKPITAAKLAEEPNIAARYALEWNKFIKTSLYMDVLSERTADLGIMKATARPIPPAGIVPCKKFTTCHFQTFNTKVDMNNGTGYYLGMRSGNYIDGMSEGGNTRYWRHIEWDVIFKQLGMDAAYFADVNNKQLYLIKDTFIKNFSPTQSKNLVPLSSRAPEFADKMLKPGDLENLAISQYFSSSEGLAVEDKLDKQHSDVNIISNIAKNFDPDHLIWRKANLISDFYDTKKKYQNYEDTFKEYVKFIKMFRVTSHTTALTKAVAAYSESVKDKWNTRELNVEIATRYPMLTLIINVLKQSYNRDGMSKNSQVISDITNYVKTQDKILDPPKI